MAKSVKLCLVHQHEESEFGSQHTRKSQVRRGCLEYQGGEGREVDPWNSLANHSGQIDELHVQQETESKEETQHGPLASTVVDITLYK